MAVFVVALVEEGLASFQVGVGIVGLEFDDPGPGGDGLFVVATLEVGDGQVALGVRRFPAPSRSPVSAR